MMLCVLETCRRPVMLRKHYMVASFGHQLSWLGKDKTLLWKQVDCCNLLDVVRAALMCKRHLIICQQGCGTCSVCLTYRLKP